MKRYSIYLLLIVILSSNALWSQKSIKGTITDEIQAPVMGADIYIEQLHIGTTSDENGKISNCKTYLKDHINLA